MFESRCFVGNFDFGSGSGFEPRSGSGFEPNSLETCVEISLVGIGKFSIFSKLPDDLLVYPPDFL